MELNDFNRKKKPFFGYFICAVLGSIFGCALLLLFGPGTMFSKFDEAPKTTQIIGEAQQLSTTGQAMTEVGIAANKVMPAVVGIVRPINEKTNSSSSQQVEIGTGVIVDPSGYILTNNHVADSSKGLNISLFDGKNVLGKVVWTDPVLDISIAKINEPNLQAAPLGNSQDVSIGDVAIAIGNPLGLKFQRSVTSGIISAVNRTVQLGPSSFMEDLLQTDASINPGNSGGPLINVNGEVIGINTVKVTTAEGMGFAIPINMAKPIIDSIKKTGQFVAPVLGIQGADIDMMAYFNYKVDRGVYVIKSLLGSPGYNAGISVGDSIIAVNSNNINTLLDLKEALYNIGINGTAIITIETPLKTQKTLTVKLVPFNCKAGII